MTDSQVVAAQLENMGSHGIFDSEYVAAQFRAAGWQFVHDPAQGSTTGGAYFIRTPAGIEGYINWFNASAINQLTSNAVFFVEDGGPQKMFLSWIFADQMGRLILGKPFDETPEGESLPPGRAFEGAYNAFRQAAGIDTVAELETAKQRLQEAQTPVVEEPVTASVLSCDHSGGHTVVTTNPDRVTPTHLRCNSCGDLYPISADVSLWPEKIIGKAP